MTSRPRASRRRASVGLLLAAVVIVAAGAPAGGLTDPAVWANTFCTTTTGYADGARQAGDEFNTNVLSDPKLTAQGLREAFVEYVGGGVEATQALGSEIKLAGAPKVVNGAKIQTAILAGVAGTVARLTALEKGATVLPTKNEKLFTKGFYKLLDKLEVFFDPFEKGVAKADSLQKDEELDAVFANVPSCASLSD